MNLSQLMLPFGRMLPSALLRRFIVPTTIVFAMTCVVMGTTLLRDLLIAYQFGTGDAVDAFLIALLVPTACVQVVGVALGTAIVPRIMAIERASGTSARGFIRHITSAGLLVLATVSLVLICLSGFATRFLTVGFSAPKAALTEVYFFWLLPCIILQGWSAVVSAIVNARNRFTAVAAAPALRPALTVLLLVGTGSAEPMLLVWGFLGGSFLEAGVVAWSANRAGIPLGLARPTADTWRALKGFGPTSASSIVMALSVLATQYLAGLIAPGSLAALSYGGKAISLVIALSALPLGITALPLLSDFRTQMQWNALAKVLIQGAAALVALGSGTAFVCSWFAIPIVSILFHRGAFTASDVTLVADIQSYLAWQLPFYLVGILWVRALAAFQQNWGILVVALINAATNLAVSLTLMPAMGVQALALGVTLGYAAAAVAAGSLSLFYLRKERHQSSALASLP